MGSRPDLGLLTAVAMALSTDVDPAFKGSDQGRLAD